MAKNQFIIVSDLHIERWRKAKKQLFFEFLDFVSAEALELFILGDIVDIPQPEHKDIIPTYQDIFERLYKVTKGGLKIHYIVGNHDIVMRSVKVITEFLEIHYPTYEKKIDGRRIYLEHGHFYDPFFYYHIYDTLEYYQKLTGVDPGKIAVDLYRDLLRAFQFRRRREAVPSEKREKPSPVGVPKNILDIWEREARNLLTQRKYNVVVFGHTHSPMNKRVGENQFYVNSGDWVNHATYVVFVEGKHRLMDFQRGKEISMI